MLREHQAVFLVSLIGCSFCQTDFKDVNTDQGIVRGYKIDDEAVFSFYGIPYATGPTGEDRFKAPFPPPTWTDVFNATQTNIACPQSVDAESDTIQLTFDCLIINVFVPDNQETNLPVFAFVHGGGFQKGYATESLPINLVKKGMIVASLNYRVGLHGFLCLGTEYAPGNAGMKDQIAALRWVHRNIASFGGNPNDVTLGGSSAGSFSAELLMLSPAGNGLFTKVVTESGSGLSHEAVGFTPLEIAENFANQQGLFFDQNIQALENYYRSLSDEQLMHLRYESDFWTVGFIPCVETHTLPNVEKFLEEKPISILKNRTYEKRPNLSGFTLMEGLLFSYRYETDKLEMEKDFSQLMPKDILFNSIEEKLQIAGKVKDFYFPEEEITHLGYFNFFTDTIFAYPLTVTARMHAKNDIPVFLYMFTFNGTVNLPIVHLSPIWGPGHIAQSLYLQEYSIPLVYDFMTENDFLVQDRLHDMWYNFVKFGEPIPAKSSILDVEWPQLNYTLFNYLDLDLQMQVAYYPLAERIALWDEIYGYFDD